MKPTIGLSDEQREGVINILNTLLSDEQALYMKTRNYHWNVFGPQFNDLHKFFEAQYEELERELGQTTSPNALVRLAAGPTEQ